MPADCILNAGRELRSGLNKDEDNVVVEALEFSKAWGTMVNFVAWKIPKFLTL